MIVTAGMIASGKTTVAELISKELDSEMFYESVDDNPILPLFYQASDEEIESNRYPFLLQLYFLNSRFDQIKDAYHDRNNTLDRSIYEDWYFAKVNHDLGRINDLEFSIYESLLNNMMQELETLPQKAPDIMVYLRASFETILFRIGLRGRDFEIDEELKDYYYALWKGYDDWVMNHYDKSDVVIIDMDKVDVETSEIDAQMVIDKVKAKLAERDEKAGA
ncbi:deoxyadenosine kinase [Geomicrobium sp. JCM 19055]|nr:deoxyadenosine kinase [Geomicrobium sp. JCM 19055]